MSLQEVDASPCNTYDYGDAAYWNRRYLQDPDPFDWYQRYSGIAPLARKFVPKSARILMAGCGNAVFSEDMVKDGYQEIINIDISPVVVEMMQKKYYNVHQMKYLTMDVRDLSLFEDTSFDSVIDKGTLDSLMITYGQPCSRMPHLNIPAYNWTITLYEIPRPDLNKAAENPSVTDPVPLNKDGSCTQTDRIDDPDCHYVYVCVKEEEC